MTWRVASSTNRRPQVPFGCTEGFKKAGAKKWAKIGCFEMRINFRIPEIVLGALLATALI